MIDESMPAGLEAKPGKMSEDEAKKLLETIEEWWLLAREAHAENRVEQRTDADFYDHIQYTEEELAILRERNQSPIVFNKLKQAIDWVIGTQRRAKMDFNVFPREEGDVDAAQAKKHLLKYISDASMGQFEWSQAFEDAVKVGEGWIEEGVRNDVDEEPVFYRHEHYGNLWRDPFSKRNDLDDCRFIFRSKWTDLDVAKALTEEKHHRALEEYATVHVYANTETPDEDFDLPAMFTEVDQWGRTRYRTKYSGMVDSPKKARKRVRLIECWYRKPKKVHRIWSRDSYFGEQYDESDATMVEELHSGRATLTDAMTFEMCCALFIPGRLLDHCKTPYRHNRFPFTPIWCFRRDRDNMAYGLIRGVRDAQMDLNKRMSKALYVLSTNQVLYEDGAIEDLDEFTANLANPAGALRVRAGTLANKRLEILRNNDIADGHIRLMELDAQHILDGSGVTRENLGQDTNARTGVAIARKQAEGGLATAKIFDNLRFARQLSGQKLLSLIEEYMIAERQIRILGKNAKPEFLSVNAPEWNGEEWVFKNDITASKADFIVDDQDFSADLRAAMADSMLTVIGQIPDPMLQMQLIDIPISLMDIPKKDEIIDRIRQQLGLPPIDMIPGSQEEQEWMAQQEQAQEEQARQQSIQEAEILAKNKALAAKSKRDEASALEAIQRARMHNMDVETTKEFFQSGGNAETVLNGGEQQQ